MVASTDTGVGVQSVLDVNAIPVIPNSSWAANPATWSWIWFVVAIIVILGFHIRVFGRPVPPAARFP